MPSTSQVCSSEDLGLEGLLTANYDSHSHIRSPAGRPFARPCTRQPESLLSRSPTRPLAHSNHSHRREIACLLVRLLS